MKKWLVMLSGLLPVSILAAGVLEVRAPGYDFRNAEYTTSHVFVDEVAGSSADIELRFDPQVAGVVDVEIFSNLNRRDLADADKDADGVPDGILPPNGALITDSASDTDPETGHYYIPHNMSYDSRLGWWTLTIPAEKTGAYRLTARFRKESDAEWTWYGLRDHCVVVSPVTARDIRLYELNVLTVEASGTMASQRSTWEDLSDRSGALHTTASRPNQWNLDYAKGLGVNWLWFQPYHPYGIDGRGTAGPSWVWNGGSPYEDVAYPFALGSPYAVKNFWQIEPRTSALYDPSDSVEAGRAKAMTSFRNFVADADAEGIQIMTDAVFNHGAFDMELGQKGVELWSNGAGWSPTDEIRLRELRVFSREDDYYQRAGLGAGEGVASAPDRYDFGKWTDVKDIFFGRYAALWRNAGSTDQQKDESDWFDYSSHAFNGTDGGSFDAVTRGVWQYFAAYAPYWLAQTRTRLNTENRNSTASDFGGDKARRYAFDAEGIDGIRCDFAQGLPPQAWEYIINVARSYKWSFVFMAESLDGGAVTYRSGRHFDILNENALFAVKSASSKWDLSRVYEDRRSAYGEALVLLNTVSHDEQNYSDPWVALSRYAANCSIGGAPMIFAGQELGLSDFFGYDLMEVNFGKYVPHFKTCNSMMPAWSDTDFGNDQLYHVYAAMNAARSKCEAIPAGNRWFLDGEGYNGNIFAVAKYEIANAPLNEQEVVLCFVNLDRDNNQGDQFKIPVGLAALIGLDDARLYNVVNMAAYDETGRGRLLWNTPLSGAALQDSGFHVSINKVPTSEAGWKSAPYEAQYLQLVDVTEPLEVDIDSIAVGESNVVIRCPSIPGRYYQLESSEDGLAGTWSGVLSNVEADGADLELVHAGGAVSSSRFYRVLVSFVRL
ncbi:MAG: hypothetical protein JXR25_10075 [Pontiellaceae bacterium]|nr:hypothetical protein [Pontiellaceae bacterium]MBN2785165.1 hypothetical protein [Pontiellaceae bacterium]